MVMQEVDSLLEDAGNIVATFEGNTFVKLLVEGLNWLRKACSVIPDCQNSKRHKLVDAEEIVNDIPVGSFFLKFKLNCVICCGFYPFHNHYFYFLQMHAMAGCCIFISSDGRSTSKCNQES